MRDVVKHVVTSFQQNPRRIIALYSNAVCADVWRNASILEEIPSSRKWIAIYDTQALSLNAQTREGAMRNISPPKLDRFFT